MTTVYRLRGLVSEWTGNQLQVVDLSLHEWLVPAKPQKGVMAHVQRDGVELVRAPGLHGLSPKVRP